MLHAFSRSDPAPKAVTTRTSARVLRRRGLPFTAVMLAVLLAPATTLYGAGSGGGGKGGSTAAATPAAPTITVPLQSSTVCSTPLALISGAADISIDDLLDRYRNGQWVELRSALATISASVRESKECKNTAGKKVFSARDRISFVIIDDRAPQPTIIRILHGGSPPPDFSSQRLLGSGPLYTVYLYRIESKTPVFTTYTASPSPSPVEAGLSQVVSSAAGGLSKIAAPGGAASGKGLSASLLEIASPVSDIQKADIARVLQAPSHPDDIALRLSSFLAAVAAKVKKHLQPVIAQCVVTETDVPGQLRWAQVSATDSANLQSLLTVDSISTRVRARLPAQGAIKALYDAIAATFVAGSPCSAFASPQGAQDKTLADKLPQCQNALAAALNDALKNDTDGVNRDAAMAMYSMYAGSLTATAQVSAQTAYSYGPLTHWAFGLGAGFIARSNLNRQVKLSGGALTEDQGNGTVTSVNVYFSPSGYDETTLEPAGREVFPRIVGGFVLTPNPGVFLGIGAALPVLRNLTVNGGYALTLATVPVGDAHVGDTATATKRGALGAWIAELGYSF